MRKLFLSLILAIHLLAPFSLSVQTTHAAVVPVKINGLESRSEKGCYWDDATKGVLVDHKIIPGSAETDDKVFNCYLRVFLAGNSALIITIAVIIVVFSGIQYMLALGNSSAQGKAKQRVVSVVTGVIFLTLIRFFLTIIGT